MNKKNIVSILLAVVISIAIIGCNSAPTAVVDKNSPKEQIRQVQQRLKDLGYYQMTVDGIFGNGTKEAVKAFQRDKKLHADGIIGENTLKALDISFANKAGKYTTSELDLLARLVHGEAKNKSYVEKVAVAAIVLNRVKHPDFPNTVAGVIYQHGAFNSVSGAGFNKTPYKAAYDAARDAMHGFDPTLGQV